MRCLKIRPIAHLDGTVTYDMVVPVGTRRTKRRTWKKWMKRAIYFQPRRVSLEPPPSHADISAY